MTQETFVFGIVILAAFGILQGVYRARFAMPLARWLLKRGHVKWAMRVRGSAAPGGH